MAEERVERRLAAIMVADVVGYSHLMEIDEAGTLSRLKRVRSEIFDPTTDKFRGHVFKSTGDGALAEFSSAVDAVQCAVDIQRGLAKRNADQPENARVILRIGISLGDVIVDGDDLFGNGVNVAARLEGLAEAGGICVSGNVHEHLGNALDVAFEDLGEQTVKNIERPVRAYRVNLEPAAATPMKGHSDTPPALPSKPSIVVLPFQNMSGDPEQEYFSDGISEDITTCLSRFNWFFVIARNSAFTYKGKAVNIAEVARELGVQYVLEGSVRKAGNRVRITAQLIDATTNSHVWADQYDRELTDIFAVQDEITQAITGTVAPEFISAEARRASRKAPESMDAWDYTVRGASSFWRMDKESMAEARRLFENALNLDPNNLIALSCLALTCSFQTAWGTVDDRDETRLRAEEASKRAIDLHENDAWAQAAYSLVSAHAGRHDVSLRAARRAVELNPNLALAEGFLAQRLAWAGNYEEANLHADRAERLSPRDPAKFWWNFPRAVAAFMASDYEEYRRWATSVTEDAPHFAGGWINLAVSNAYLDRPDEAKAALEKFISLIPNGSVQRMASFIPAQRAEDKERFLEGCRKAGLPE
jgi:adenylate cyclase